MGDLAHKRVLITGAGGFIGANLAADLLRRGAEVHAIVRPSTNLWRLQAIKHALHVHLADLTDRARVSAVVKDVQPQIIFNTAVLDGHPSNADERLQALHHNVIATANLLEALGPIAFERLVHLGSSLEYGWKRTALQESDRLEPVTYRGVTKAAATLLCQQFALAEQRPVVIVRPFSVFGYWEAPTRIVPAVMFALLKGQDLPLTESGIRRDFIFIEDVVEMAVLAATACQIDGQIFNVGSGQQWSNEELAAAAQQVTGRVLRVIPGAFPRRAADTDHWVADVSKARQVLGWTPRHSLTDGLVKTFAWFNEHEAVYWPLRTP